MVTVCHFELVGHIFETTHKMHLVVFILVQNLIGIIAVVFIYKCFAFGLRIPIYATDT